MNQPRCDRCGTYKNVKRGSGASFCKICEQKLNIPVSITLKNKGGLFKFDVLHVVNEKNKTPKDDYGWE